MSRPLGHETAGLRDPSNKTPAGYWIYTACWKWLARRVYCHICVWLATLLGDDAPVSFGARTSCNVFCISHFRWYLWLEYVGMQTRCSTICTEQRWIVIASLYKNCANDVTWCVVPFIRALFFVPRCSHSALSQWSAPCRAGDSSKNASSVNAALYVRQQLHLFACITSQVSHWALSSWRTTAVLACSEGQFVVG